MKPTRLLSALVIGAAVLLGGCGSSGGGGDAGDGGAGPDTDAAGTVAVEFFEAFAGGDYERACELLSQAERSRMTRTEESLSSQEGRSSRGCAGGLQYNFRPDPIEAPKVGEAEVYNDAVEVFLTTGTDLNLSAQVVDEGGQLRVDEFATALEPMGIEPVCDKAADQRSELPAPKEEWLTAFREDYYVDFSDDRVVTSGREYTRVLIDELELCGMPEKVFEQLVDSVVSASPTSLNAPPELTFDSFGTDQFFTCELVNVAANTYEVTRCTIVDSGG